MPESLDFEQLARRMFPVEDTGQDAVGVELSAESRDHLISQLRLVWNARGAADAHAVQIRSMELFGTSAGGIYAGHYTKTIHALDR